MYATIQSEYFYDFYCRVNNQPIIQTENYNVYELVDSMFPNDIIKKAKNKREKIFRHIAIDNQSVGYLFDINSKKLDLNMGICQYIEDKR